MVLREPRDEEVEPAPPACRSEMSPPLRPHRDESAKPEQADDVSVRGVFQEADRRPLLVQSTEGSLAAK